ncbi:MAG: DUF2235 domain-containing protein [Bryobacteraceae bacterium]
MPKNIVLCCDSVDPGWRQTNVANLFSALDRDDPNRQVAMYRPGLGGSTAAGQDTPLGGWKRSWKFMMAVCFGYGVSDDIAEFYKFLIEEYQPDDRVFLFGFGRGAYIIRTLAAMLRLLGLLRPGDEARIPYGIDLMKSLKPDAAARAAEFKANFSRECKTNFAGTWDTVRSVGVFSGDLFATHMAENSDIAIVRHALAVDERRSAYRANLFGKESPGQDVRQVWFAGTHFDVGGGQAEGEEGLSRITLQWMMREAATAGVLFKDEVVGRLLPCAAGLQIGADAVVHRSLSGVWWLVELLPAERMDVSGTRMVTTIPMGRARRIPEGALIHESVLRKKAADPRYDPRNLPPQFATEPWTVWPAERVEREASHDPFTPVSFPETLLNDVRSGQCVLYAGAGMSATAGLPVWADFAAKLVSAASEAGHILEKDVEFYRKALDDRKSDYVVDEVVGHAPQEFVLEFLREIFLSQKVPRVMQELAPIPFAAALTTNFDDLLDQALAEPMAGKPVLTPSDPEKLLSALTRRDFFMLHLYGVISRPETLLTSPAQFDEAISVNLPFRNCIESLFVSRTIFFVACSLEGIETYLRGLRLRGKPARRHYALCGVIGTSWEAMAGVLDRRYGIEVIPYRVNDGADLLNAIRKFKGSVGPVEKRAPKTGTSPLKRVVLTNIGPFEYLDHNLNSDTNVFLGDNGVGKSTILRAIAVALAGKQAEPWADRLVRSGATHASIRLETDRETYQTTIELATSGAVLTPSTVNPLETEGWLAIGFPPLRTTSGRRGSGLPSGGATVPVVADILPLAKGEPDLRLDALQDWIINLDYQIKDALSRNTHDSLSEKLCEAFFETVAALTKGMKLEFRGVDAKTKRITIHTDDGDVPLEWLSQGTASLISWVGVILQRLYEIYGGEGDPRKRYVLVLMDEIDAHMHPAWQRVLLRRLRNIFPGMQLITTTHSALIISGLKSDRVFRVIRDPKSGSVIVREFEMTLTGKEPGELLESPLFGLEDSRDPNTEEDHARYAELRLKAHIGEDERVELEKLRASLFGRKSDAIQEAADDLHHLVRQTLSEKIKAASVEEKERLLGEAKLMIEKELDGNNS